MRTHQRIPPRDLGLRSDDHTHFFLAQQPVSLALNLAGYICLLLIFFSCSPIDRFSEYRGVNLLEGKSLSDWTPDYNEVSPPAPANPEEEAYMLYQSAGAIAGYNGSEAFRLRTKNLFPNGDFEGGSLTGWELIKGATSSTFSISGSAIQGVSLNYTISASTDYIRFPLSNLADGFLPSIPYTFRFDVKYTSTGSDTLSFDTNTDPATDGSYLFKLQKPKEIKTYYRYPADYPDSPLLKNVSRTAGQNLYFFLNTALPDKGDPQIGIIDNIRFLRSDLQYKIRLVLPRTDPTNPNRLPLPSGSYRFSFYVKQDPDAGSNNVFPASRISFGIGNAYKTVDASSIGSDWTKVEGTFNNLQIDPGSTMELWISATDSTADFYRDCGSILISSPSLEFLPE